MPITIPRAWTPGKIRFSASAAAGAFGVWPPMHSSWTKRDCRTGLEYETMPESTRVIQCTPQPRRQRATAHPSVPAPMSKQRCDAMSSGCSAGMSRHRINRMLSSTLEAAMETGSI
eukprot:scaffold29290_cov31-Tisochrysis_lutea.AAC.1